MSNPSIPLRRLGRSGLTVSRLCLGTMMFGARTEEAEARRIVDDAAAIGVNFIDTADSYAEGRSEEITGRAIAADRDRWILATKLANPMGEGPNRRGLSRKWIHQEVRASLSRLGTDYVDILYLHKEDRDTPAAETVRAIADLIRSGAIRYFGVSNFRAWRMAEICALCDREGIDRPIVNQLLYHPLNRSAEVETLPACRHFGVGAMVYSPLARGVLTGKYAAGAQASAESRAGRGDKRMLEAEFHPASLLAADELARLAAAREMSLADFSLAWTLANPAVTGLIAGPRTLEQWQSYRKAFEIAWRDEDDRAVDAVVGLGATAVPQFFDPAYPPEGRFRP